MESADVKQLWGEEFRVVPQGLAEDDVVPFVNRLMERSSSQQRDEEDEAARTLADAEEQARVQAQRMTKKAERDAAALSNASMAKAEKEAQDIVAKARTEAQDIVQDARDKAASTESEAKLEAEYLIRRMTVKFVEEIRSVVMETSNNMLPSLDSEFRSGQSDMLEEGAEAQPAIAPPRSKSKSSAR